MMLRRVLKSMSLKKFFKRQREGVMFMEIPTHFKTLAEREEFMEATLDKLEKTIYKTI